MVDLKTQPIPMLDALSNLGIELDAERKEYFKDKVLTHIIYADKAYSDLGNDNSNLLRVHFNFNDNETI